LEIPISVVIWIGFLEGKGEKGKRRDTYFWSHTLLFCLLLFGEQPVQLTLLLVLADLFEARISAVPVGRNWMDGLIFTLRTLVVSSIAIYYCLLFFWT